MRITLEGSMQEIELLAQAVAAGCQALRGRMGGRPHQPLRDGAHEREADGDREPAEERFRVCVRSKTDADEEPRLIDMTARTLEEAVARAVNWMDEHADEGKQAFVVEHGEGCWREVWPNG